MNFEDRVSFAGFAKLYCMENMIVFVLNLCVPIVHRFKWRKAENCIKKMVKVGVENRSTKIATSKV